MSNYRARPSRPDRAKAIAAVVAVHAAMAALLLIRPDMVRAPPEPPPTVLIDITPPPPPPQPIEPQAGRTRDEEGAAGKKAEPTPVVAPEPKIVVPTPQPLPAAHGQHTNRLDEFPRVRAERRRRLALARKIAL